MFWKFRKFENEGQIDSFYLDFLQKNIDTNLPDQHIIEVGCSDGYTLGQFANQLPTWKFTGIDLQTQAIETALEKYKNMPNMDFICKSILDDTIEWDCDYLLSRTTLIYLNYDEIKLFFQRTLPKIKSKLLLIEVISVSDKTENLHYFAHPIKSIFEQSDFMNEFTIDIELLDYEHWISDGAAGAAVSIVRK